MYVKLPIVLLALIEGSFLFFSTYLAAAIRFGGEIPDSVTTYGSLWPTALIFALCGLVALFAVGLYSTRQRAGFAGLLVRIVAAILAAAAMSALIFYLLPAFSVWRGQLALMTGIGIAVIAILRLLFERVVDQEIFKRRVLVYGAGQRARSLLQLRRRSDTRGFRILGFIPTEGDRIEAPDERRIDRPEDLYDWALDNQVSEIVMAMDDRRRGFPVHELLECRLAGIEVVDLASFLERETGKVHLDVVSPSWIIFGEGFRVSPVQRALERGFDIVASSGLLLIGSPLMLLAMLAIKLEDGLRAPVLYRQRRVGRYGEVYDVLKFRSMSVDAETAGAVWAQKNDPRVTRVGNIMRKTRIDEMPQLINVLRGDMSFVGPRPERPEFVQELEQRIPYYTERHTVKPGITGWAQLCYPYGSSEKDAVEKLQYDLYYVKHRSLLFDLAILVQTVEVVLWGKGAR
jgi:sugar transferase (PEP-CTERM system associated)